MPRNSAHPVALDHSPGETSRTSGAASLKSPCANVRRRNPQSSCEGWAAPSSRASPRSTVTVVRCHFDTAQFIEVICLDLTELTRNRRPGGSSSTGPEIFVDAPDVAEPARGRVLAGHERGSGHAAHNLSCGAGDSITADTPAAWVFRPCKPGRSCARADAIARTTRSASRLTPWTMLEDSAY